VGLRLLAGIVIGTTTGSVVAALMLTLCAARAEIDLQTTPQPCSTDGDEQVVRMAVGRTAPSTEPARAQQSRLEPTQLSADRSSSF